MTGDAYSVFIDVIEVVEILCAVIKSACCHHSAGVARIFIVAVTFAVDYEHHETAAGKLDGVLKLHFAVVEIAVREYDAGRGVVGGCAVGLEQNAADHGALHLFFLRHGFARFFVCGYDGYRARIGGVPKVRDFHRPAVRLYARRYEAAQENHYQTDRQENDPFFVFGQIAQNTVFQITHNFSFFDVDDFADGDG